MGKVLSQRFDIFYCVSSKEAKTSAFVSARQGLRPL